MDENNDFRSSAPNSPRGREERIRGFASMSAEELAEEYERLWNEMDEENYDGELMRACLDALDEKSPLPDLPDVEKAYARFTDARRAVAPERKVSPEKAHPRRIALKVAIAAAIAVAAVFGALVTAQASGYDVFGAIARWTRETFSFGSGETEPVSDTPSGTENGEDVLVGSIAFDGALRFQRSLEENGVPGANAPGWMPDGYALAAIHISQSGPYEVFSISAEYRLEGSDVIRIGISQFSSLTSSQIQKSPDFIGFESVCGTQLYFLKNENNCTAAWADGEYEYYVVGKNEEDIRHVAESMIN